MLTFVYNNNKDDFYHNSVLNKMIFSIFFLFKQNIESIIYLNFIKNSKSKTEQLNLKFYKISYIDHSLSLQGFDALIFRKYIFKILVSALNTW